MTDEKKPDAKKGIPNGFLWFLMAAFLMALMVQSLIETKVANVAFSYQLEHLVNLQLINPEDSRKIALNDNLVTFSGKFRENTTEEGKKRYKFLELLDANHQLASEKVNIQNELKETRGSVEESAEWFLRFSGIPIPKDGYVVVDDFYNSNDQDYNVVIKDLKSSPTNSLAELKSQFNTLKSGSSDVAVAKFGKDLSELIHNFRSPQLGIGSESIKQNLKDLEKQVQDINNINATAADRLNVYDKALSDLQFIVNDLNEFEGHARLTK